MKRPKAAQPGRQRSSRILAVMTRAALGHTGRPLVVARSIDVAYFLVPVAAALRVAAPSIQAPGNEIGIIVAGVIWASAFAMFTIVYWPILTRPSIGEAGE